MAPWTFEYVDLAWVKREAQDLQVCVRWKPGEPSVCYSLSEALELADHAEREGQHGLAKELRHFISLAAQEAKAP